MARSSRGNTMPPMPYSTQTTTSAATHRPTARSWPPTPPLKHLARRPTPRVVLRRKLLGRVRFAAQTRHDPQRVGIRWRAVHEFDVDIARGLQIGTDHPHAFLRR